MSKVIGIDLGSTTSAVAILEANKPMAVTNAEGNRTTPSVIALKGGERKVGEAAKRQMVVNPKETVNIIKRFMGATFDESKEAIKHVNYEVINKDGMPRVNIEGREYSPEELSSMIVSTMKKTAEDYLGEEVKDAVITVPAFFSDKARAATKTAGELAGLNVLRVVAEPTAAILASNISMEEDGKYMVVDFGGSTLDNSVAEIGGGVVEILASNGDVYLGGTDLDKALADFIVDTFNKAEGIDLSKDVQAYARVIEAAETAKIALSTSTNTDINLPYITMTSDGPKHLTQTITRAKFEQIATPFVDRLIVCAKAALKEADLEASELKGILLVGGSCRIPFVQERLTKEFGVDLIKSANLDLAVAEGAAVQGGIITKEIDSDLVLLDVVPLGYGIETLGGVMTTIVESNTTIPCHRTETFSTAQDNQSSVDIKIMQGNRPMAKDNKEVGLFRLDGILPARRGVPQIEVSFDIDANGILKVSAKDKGTGKEQNITIESKGGLSKEEIEQMKADAERFAEQDKKEREVADTVNKGDGIVFSQEKMIEEMGDKLSEDDKKELNELIDKMKAAVKDKHVDAINATEKEINDKWNKLSEKLYSNAQQPQQEEATAETNSAEGGEDTVQDADFEEV